MSSCHPEPLCVQEDYPPGNGEPRQLPMIQSTTFKYATSVHRQITDERLAAAGVPAGLVRMFCGLECKTDLMKDIKQALEAI